MRRICTLAALLTVALGFGVDGARAAHIETPPAQGAGAVTAVSVVPADGRADVVIAVSGTVSVNHFTVENPDRIVIDISEARLGSFPRRYDGRARGGITDIRFAQNRPGVVRVVVQMNAKLPYTVSRTNDAIRVAVSTTGEFAAWSSHPQATNVAEATRPAPTTPPAEVSRPTPAPATPPTMVAAEPPA
ncbi:MAG TPA: AMIN domain-containing protein, partial [Gemmatimonadaceae bacterium]